MIHQLITRNVSHLKKFLRPSEYDREDVSGQEMTDGEPDDQPQVPNGLPMIDESVPDRNSMYQNHI